MPRGRIIEVYGPESSRETTLGLHIVAEAHKRGGVAGHIDAEHAMDIGSAHKLGVRTMRPSRDSSPAFKKAPQSRHSTVMQLPNSRFWVFWASTLAALGCSSGAPVADGGAGGDGGFGPDSGGFSAGDAGAFGDAGTEHGSDAGRTVAVRVTMRSTTLRTDAGSPLTWSELNASVALFTEAADGGLLEWPGSQMGDAVVFAHVPTGDYVVRYGRAFYVNASDDLDLGGTTHRRPDLKYVDAGTTLALNVAGLPAWNGTMTPNDDGTNADDLQLFSPSANLYAYAEVADLETHSTGDVTSLFRLDYAALANGWAPLVDASKNDQLWLSYMQHQPIHHETVTWYFDDGGWADGDLGYNCQVSSLTALVSPQVHPGYNGVTVAFGQPPASVANLDWRRSQALERDREVHPQARNPYLEELYFVAEPNSYDSSADLIRCTGGNYPWNVLLGPDAGQPLDIRATIAVGDPYPTSWHRRWYWSVWRSAPSSLPADGGSSLVRANEWAFYENGEPIAPTVHPPTALRVNKGLATPSAAEPLLVEWAPSGKAPAPTRYRLYLRRRVPDGTTEGVAQVRTTATHFAFPPGVVEAGAVYYVRVAAERSSSPANRPFEGETTDHAEAVSDFFVPVR